MCPYVIIGMALKVLVLLPGSGLCYLVCHGQLENSGHTVFLVLLEITVILLIALTLFIPMHYRLEREMLHGKLLKSRTLMLRLSSGDSNEIGTSLAPGGAGSMQFDEALLQVVLWQSFKGSVFRLYLMLLLYYALAGSCLPLYSDIDLNYVLAPCTNVGQTHIITMYLVVEALVLLPAHAAFFVNNSKTKSVRTEYLGMVNDGVKVDLRERLRRDATSAKRMDAQLLADCLLASDTGIKAVEGRYDTLLICEAKTWLVFGRGWHKEQLAKYGGPTKPNVQGVHSLKYLGDNALARPALPWNEYVQLWSDHLARDEPFECFHAALWEQNQLKHNDVGIEQQTGTWVYNLGPLWRIEEGEHVDCTLNDLGDCWIVAFQGCC